MDDRLVGAPLYEKPDTFYATKSSMESAVDVDNLAQRLRGTNATLGDLEAHALVDMLGDTLNLQKWEFLAKDWQMQRPRRC